MEPEGPTFLAFAGSGKRLDGKTAAPAAPVTVRLGAYEVRDLPKGSYVEPIVNASSAAYGRHT